ncbi:hypothetical protein DSUL_160053 [Desulfovibrionales bacterium]
MDSVELGRYKKIVIIVYIIVNNINVLSKFIKCNVQVYNLLSGIFKSVIII